MDSHAAPSGGSASDDWTKPGRTRGKARGSTRADAPADSALRHGSGDATDHVPELGAQTAAPPPGNDEFTAPPLYCRPPTCNAYHVAILLHADCAIYTPPSTLPFHAIHHTLLVMVISCIGGPKVNGRIVRLRVTHWPLQDIAIANIVLCMA